MKITDIIVNNIEYNVLEISIIKHNMKNPSIRTDRNNNSFKSLKNNIKTNGLISPIVVDRNYNLIDGHRRLNALKDLGHKLVPVNINKAVNPKNYGKVFKAANHDTMKITATQETEMYLNGATEISSKVLSSIKALEKIGGRAIIRRIAIERKAPGTFVSGVRMYCKHVNDHTLKAQKDVLYWMFNVDTCYKLKACIHSCVDAKLIRDCIKNRKKLVFDWFKK